jgi:protein-tyrosine-phosphatase
MVVELGHSDRRVGELVQIVGKSQSLISYHLAELRRAGIVAARRSSADGRDVYYRVDVARCRQLLADAGVSLHRGYPVDAHRTADQATGRGRTRLLFLCTGNSARSQIAEALAEHRSAGTVEAVSAGSHPKPLHRNAVRVMAARGVDIADRSSTPLATFLRTRFDRVITLCDKVREVCPEFAGAPITSHWSIADPAAAGRDDETTYPEFVRVADEIEARVEVLLAELPSPSLEGIHHG